MAGPRFVAEAWRQVLGREVDPAGFAGALRRLDEGGSRRALMVRLARSDEGLAMGATGTTWPVQAAVFEHARRLVLRPWLSMTSAVKARRRIRYRPVLRPLSWEPVAGAPADLAESSPRVRSEAALAVFTIVAANYLSQARVLMASVARHHPEAARVVVVIGGSGQKIDDPFECLDAASLHIENFADMTVRYGVLELATAVKPFAFRALFDRASTHQVVYLDPDIELYGRLDAALGLLQAGAPIVLTPHATEPLPGPGLPDDHTLLRSGVFNLGFMAARRDRRTADWLTWWADRLKVHCLVDFAANLFTDQRWCDLAPCMVEGLAILRDPGCNVAYWNLEHRPLARDQDGQWRAAGWPLVFFHFSGFDPERPTELSRHQTRLSAGLISSVAPLLRDYAGRLQQMGWASTAREPYSFDAVDATGRIGPLLRRFYRWRWPQAQAGDRHTLLERLLHQAWIAPPGDLPPLLRFLHASDPELRGAFDASRESDRGRLMSWFVHRVVPAEGLDTLFVTASLTVARSTP